MRHQGRRNSDQNLILALACGSTVDNAARQAGVSDTTAHRRLKDPLFKAKVQAARNEMLERTAAMLTAASLESVKTLLDLQGPKNPPSVRQSAARSILEFGVKIRESSELVTRISALETQVAGAPT